MLKSLRVLFVLLMLVSDRAVGQENAQQVPPCPTPHAALHRKPKQVCQCCQKDTDAAQRGSEVSPLVVKLAESNQAQGETAKDETATPKNPSSLWTTADKIAAIASVSGFLQFLALVITIAIMIRNGRRQLRAYVVVERGIIANVANPPLAMPGEGIETVARLSRPQFGPHAQITIKNAGQTPAYNLVHWAMISVGDLPLSSSLPEMPEPDAPYWNVLGPGIPETKTLRLPFPLSAEEIQEMRDGRKAIYCHGVIKYRDAFKKERFTRYRCMYCAHCGVIGISTDLIYCEDGNYAD